MGLSSRALLPPALAGVAQGGSGGDDGAGGAGAGEGGGGGGRGDSGEGGAEGGTGGGELVVREAELAEAVQAAEERIGKSDFDVQLAPYVWKTRGEGRLRVQGQQGAWKARGERRKRAGKGGGRRRFGRSDSDGGD